ncbi:baseplate J/gp47 family protein [Falsiroseomonas sp.]|uniref:baseplate J/gp47 family protein n=1 Tax=Falsiroseomonas sp. TaxID=2870721 RepID=UPI002725810A|nr:baseplate J/gp47 family protein [Falsiroseomonas sp.]MDO9501381.1 baseplate J/gp47 family protein [Falsiroseomonas sp.]
MGFTPDTPAQIASRLAAAGEAEFAAIPPDGVDASSANAPLAVLYRAPAQALYLAGLALAAEVQDFWLDTCDVTLVPEQAARLGLSQAPAQRAGGFGAPAPGATPGTIIPAEATLGGGLYRVTAATTLDGTGVEAVPLEAVSAGVAGDLAAGTLLALDSPIAGLAAQSLTVDANGLTGGSAQETLEQLRARAITWRRRRPKGGGPGDYIAWTQAVYPNAIVKELPLWGGLGRVGVAVAFVGADGGARVATTTEQSRILDALVAQAPLDAEAITVLAATLTPLDLTIAVTPDTTAVRAAVSNAFALFLRAEPGIGGTVELSRLDEALSSAAGEFANRRTAPATPVVAGETVLLVPGTITFEAWS